MSRLWMLVVILGLATGATQAWVPSGHAQPGLQGPPPDPAVLYAQNCAACHGERGEGRMGPALTHLDDHTDDEIYHIIAEGRPERGMPAWAGRLTPEEITALVGYLRTLAAPAPPATQAEPSTPGALGVTLDLGLTQAGDQILARAALRDGRGLPMAGEEIAFALHTRLGGRLALGTFITDSRGIASMSYPAGEVPSLTFETFFSPDSANPIVAKASMELPLGEEIPPVPTGFFSPNPPPIAILLLGLVVGGVWLTYGWVAFQLLRILRAR